MTVLGIIPLTALYIYQGIHGGGRFYDPFQPALDIRGMAGSSLLYIAIILFPGIPDEIGRSDNFQAHGSSLRPPRTGPRLSLRSRGSLSSYFLVPSLFLLGFVFYYFFRNIQHVPDARGRYSPRSQALLQIAFFIAPRLPFSAPRGVGEKKGYDVRCISGAGPLPLALLAFFPGILHQCSVLYSRFHGRARHTCRDPPAVLVYNGYPGRWGLWKFLVG